MRNKFEVSAKVAIFNQDKTRILLMHIKSRDYYSLPGGHLELNENIQECAKREVFEETNVRLKEIKEESFFSHTTKNKIILGFSAIITDDAELGEETEDEGTPVWVYKNEFLKIKNIDLNYKKYILKVWNEQ